MKKIPTFTSEEEEQAYWATQDSTEVVDWSKAKRAVFPNLKPSTSRVTLRMPSWLLDELKREANRRDVPYQSLLKVVLADWIKKQNAA